MARLSPRAIAATSLIVLLALVPLISNALGQSFYITLVSRVMIFGLAAVGLNLALGYGGLVSFGQAAFYGTGAYVVMLGWEHWGWSFWLGFAVAPLVGVLPLAPAASMAVVMGAMSSAAIVAFFWVARPRQIPAFDRGPAGSAVLDVEAFAAEDGAPAPLVPVPVGCGTPTG